MTDRDTILQQMEKIRFVFQQALQFSGGNDSQTLKAYLTEVEADFRAVAYEGVAMGLAVRDLKEGALGEWRDFLRQSPLAYQSHVCVGLGWAIAKLKLPSLLFLELMPPAMVFRVLDGHGYYDGTFRHVQTLKSQARPASIDSLYFEAYDQGVGRSLWYFSEGDVSKVGELIGGFSSDRHAALWRGVGVACTFVSGTEKSALYTLLEGAGHNRKHLAFGAAVAAKARAITNTLNENTQITCSILCNEPVEKTISLLAGMEPSSETDTYTAYMGRMNEAEHKLEAALKLVGADKEN